MPVLADFVVLNKKKADPSEENGSFEHPYSIGAGSTGPFTHVFSTGGLQQGTGLLSMMVRRLTKGGPTGAGARVAISSDLNGEENIGRLQPSAAADAEVWRQQQFLIGRNIMSPGSGEDNTLIIGRVEDGDGFDTFQVRDIVVYFHQAS